MQTTTFVRVGGVLDDLQPLLLQPAAHRQADLRQRAVGVREEPGAEGVVHPRPGDDPRPAGRRRPCEERLQRPVELDRVDQAALLEQRLDPPDLPRDRAVVVVVAHASSSRDSQTSTVTLWVPVPNSSPAENRTV